MKLADTFAPWLQQSPTPAPFPVAYPEVEMNAKTPEPNAGKEPMPDFYDDARERDTEPWHCPHCEQPVDIHEVFIAPDGRTLTMWQCEPCQVVAVTPDGVKKPPPNFEPIPFVPVIHPKLPPPDPATLRIFEAAIWLEDNLTQPRRIGEIFAQWTGGAQRLQRNGSLRWEGGRDGTDGHWMTDLCEAQKLLRVTAFSGTDGLMWWTCPEIAQQRLNAA